MISIVLYGEKKENLLENIFENNIHCFFSAWELSLQKITDNHVSQHEVIYVNCGAPQLLCAGKGIVVLKENADISRLESSSGEFIMLARSSCKKQLEFLSQKKIKTLVCGLSSKDTVTFSSVSDTEAVVSLQRTTTNILGQSIDPMEIAVKFDCNYDPISVLMFTACLILLGTITQERQGDNTLYFL